MCPVLILFLNCVLILLFVLSSFFVLGSSWRYGEGAVAFRPGCSCTTRIASTSGSKGMRCNGRCNTQLLGFDPDSLHFVTTCSFPPGSFLGAIQRLFFDVRYARSSAVAHRHIGAACWLVTARLYNLKRPKSQFCSTMRAFCMIGIISHWPLST